MCVCVCVGVFLLLEEIVKRPVDEVEHHEGEGENDTADAVNLKYMRA